MSRDNIGKSHPIKKIINTDTLQNLQNIQGQRQYTKA